MKNLYLIFIFCFLSSGLSAQSVEFLIRIDLGESEQDLRDIVYEKKVAEWIEIFGSKVSDTVRHLNSLGESVLVEAKYRYDGKAILMVCELTGGDFLNHARFVSINSNSINKARSQIEELRVITEGGDLSQSLEELKKAGEAQRNRVELIERKPKDGALGESGCP